MSTRPHVATQLDARIPRSRRRLLLLALLPIALTVLGLVLWTTPESGNRAPQAGPAVSQARTSTGADVRTEHAAPQVEEPRETAQEATGRAEVPSPGERVGAERDLDVRVSDGEGVPLDGGRARVRLTDGSERHGAEVGSGRFAFEGVPEGTLEVLVEGLRGCYDAREPHAIELGPGPQRIDVRLRRIVRIPVLLRTPEGARLLEQVEFGFPGFPRRPVVLADREPFGRRIDERAPTQGEPWRAGRFLPPEDEEHDGLLECLEPPPLHAALVLGDAVLESRPVNGGERELVFVLDSSVIDGHSAGLVARIVDGTTGRVPPLEPSIIPRGFSIVDVRHQGSAFLFPIDEAGELRVDGLTPGAIRLVVDVAGFARDARTVELLPGVVRDLGTIALRPSACIAGHVVDANGSPVAVELWVGRAIDSPRGLDMGLGGASGLSDELAATGWFGICSLPRSELWLGVRSEPWAVNPIEIAPGSSLLEGLQLVARPGTRVSMRLREPRPGPTWICVRDSAGKPIWADPFVAAGESVVYLAPGSYVVTAGQAAELQWSAPLALGNEPTTLELTSTKR